MATRTVRKRRHLLAKKNIFEEEILKEDKKKPIKRQLKQTKKIKPSQLNAESPEDKSKINKSEKKPKRRKKIQSKKKYKKENDNKKTIVNSSKEAIQQLDSKFWREKLMLLIKIDTAEPKLSKKQKFAQLFLVCLTILFLLIGMITGFVLQNKHTLSKRNVMYIIFPLEIFLRILQLLTIPVLTSSIISTLGNLDIKIFGEMGLKMMTYFILTTLIAVSLGIILAMIIFPGNLEKNKTLGIEMKKISTSADKIIDIFRNAFPDNIIKACMVQTSIFLQTPENITSAHDIKNYYSWKILKETHKRTNALGLAMFSIGLGIILNIMKEEGKPIVLFFMCMNEVTRIVLKWLFWLSPIGVLFAAIGNLINFKNPIEFVKQILLYMVTDLLALFIYIMIILPFFYLISNKEKPFAFMHRMKRAISTAFITASSLATFSTSKFCIENDNRINPIISNICLPLGHIMNMNGSAISLPIATIFIAQVQKLFVDISQIIVIGLMSVIICIFTAGIPYSSIISISILLNSINLSVEDVAIILVIDWFLYAFRYQNRYQTIVNVLGNCYACAIMNKFCKTELKRMEKFNLIRKPSYTDEPIKEAKYSEVEILKIESLPRPSFQPSIINITETEKKKQDKISDIKLEKEIEERSLERAKSEVEKEEKSPGKPVFEVENVEELLEAEESEEEEEFQISVERPSKDQKDISYEEYLKRLLAD